MVHSDGTVSVVRQRFLMIMSDAHPDDAGPDSNSVD